MNKSQVENYKMTELGLLPGEWRMVRLGEVVKFTRKPSKLKVASFQRIPFIPMELIPDDGTERPRFIFKQGKDISSGTYCEPGDILLAKITPSFENGKQCVVPDIKEGFAYATTEVYSLKTKPELIDANYLFALLCYPVVRRNLAAKKEGSTGRKRLPRRVLENFSIPLPPLPEQRAIAHVLRTVQRAKEATERVVAALKELKKSLMKHLFTYGPVPLDQADQVPLKETEIGPVPEHWEVVQLGEVGEIVTGRTPSTKRSEYWNGRIPFITPVDLNGGPVRQAERLITEEGLRKAKPLPRGAVLVSCIGYIGKVGVVDVDIAVTNQQINAIIPRTVDNWFLAYALLQEAPLLTAKARKTTVPILNKTNFKRFTVPLPPFPEQREIARILQTVDRKIEAEENRKRALEALFKTLLHHLMTAQIRVPKEAVNGFESYSLGGSHAREEGP